MILNYCFYNSGVELVLQLKKMLVYVITSHMVFTDSLVDTRSQLRMPLLLVLLVTDSAEVHFALSMLGCDFQLADFPH